MPRIDVNEAAAPATSAVVKARLLISMGISPLLLVGSFIDERRQRPGLMPTARRNNLLKCGWSENPHDSAISVRLSCVPVNIRRARSTLLAATYAMGADPRLRLKAREK